MPPETADEPLQKPIAARLSREQLAVVEAWRQHLNDANPGNRFTLADALRGLVALAAALPEVKAVMSNGKRRAT
jgi:hypothetical protein